MSFIATSQGIGITENPQNVIDLLDPTYSSLGTSRGKLIKEYASIQGSPFFHENWLNGTLTTKDKSQIENLKLKIDMHKQAVWYLAENGEATILNSDMIHSVQLFDDVSGQEYILENKGTYGFLELIEINQRVKLFKGRQVTIEKGQTPTGYNQGMTEDKFVQNTEYYLETGDKVLVLIPRNKRDALKVLSSALGYEITDRVNPKKEEDLKEIIK